MKSSNLFSNISYSRNHVRTNISYIICFVIMLKYNLFISNCDIFFFSLSPYSSNFILFSWNKLWWSNFMIFYFSSKFILKLIWSLGKIKIAYFLVYTPFLFFVSFFQPLREKWKFNIGKKNDYNNLIKNFKKKDCR